MSTRFYRGASAGRRHEKNTGALAISLSSVMLVLALAAGMSWSPDKARADENGVQSQISSMTSPVSTSSPAVADECLSLLKSVRQSSASDALDRNQRKAGKAAAISLAFGLKYALQSSSQIGLSQSDPDLWLHHAPHGKADTAAAPVNALAVAQYRQCRKEAALGRLDGRPGRTNMGYFILN